MEVRPTPDQDAFIRQAVEAGRIASAEDAVAEAMGLWEERERRRAQILADVDAAEASLAQGASYEVNEQSVRALALDVTQRGRARLAAEISAKP